MPRPRSSARARSPLSSRSAIRNVYAPRPARLRRSTKPRTRGLRTTWSVPRPPLPSRALIRTPRRNFSAAEVTLDGRQVPVVQLLGEQCAELRQPLRAELAGVLLGVPAQSPQHAHEELEHLHRAVQERVRRVPEPAQPHLLLHGHSLDSDVVHRSQRRRVSEAVGQDVLAVGDPPRLAAGRRAAPSAPPRRGSRRRAPSQRRPCRAPGRASGRRRSRAARRRGRSRRLGTSGAPSLGYSPQQLIVGEPMLLGDRLGQRLCRRPPCAPLGTCESTDRRSSTVPTMLAVAADLASKARR